MVCTPFLYCTIIIPHFARVVNTFLKISQKIFYFNALPLYHAKAGGPGLGVRAQGSAGSPGCVLGEGEIGKNFQTGPGVLVPRSNFFVLLLPSSTSLYYPYLVKFSPQSPPRQNLPFRPISCIINIASGTRRSRVPPTTYHSKIRPAAHNILSSGTT